eukprot:6472906-Amphidinium_carterae.1
MSITPINIHPERAAQRTSPKNGWGENGERKRVRRERPVRPTNVGPDCRNPPTKKDQSAPPLRDPTVTTRFHG